MSRRIGGSPVGGSFVGSRPLGPRALVTAGLLAIGLSACSIESDKEVGEANCVPGYQGGDCASESADLSATASAASTTASQTTAPETTASAATEAPATTEQTTAPAATSAPATATRPAPTSQPALPNEVSVLPNFDSASAGECGVGGSQRSFVAELRNTAFCDGYVLNNTDGSGQMMGPREAYGTDPGEPVTVTCYINVEHEDRIEEWAVVRPEPGDADTRYTGGYAYMPKWPVAHAGPIAPCGPGENFAQIGTSN